jgi:hypothetical protein
MESRLSAEDRRLIKQELATIRLAAQRLAGAAVVESRARSDGPLVRAARRIERALGIHG